MKKGIFHLNFIILIFTISMSSMTTLAAYNFNSKIKYKVGFKTEIEKPWIFFDLGNTLIDQKREKKKLFYMPGALGYLKDLKKLGYRIGVISNIPEKFGTNYTNKLKSLKHYVSKNWKDSESFDWNVFDKIILPLNDRERKPAPTLFSRAISVAGNCPLLFMSENPLEVKAASDLGFSTFQVKKQVKGPIFLQKKKIKDKLLAVSKPSGSTNCF